MYCGFGRGSQGRPRRTWNYSSETGERRKHCSALLWQRCPMCPRPRIRRKIVREPLQARYLIVSEGRGDAEFLARLLAVRKIENFDVDYSLTIDEDEKESAGKCGFGSYLRMLRTEIQKDKQPTEGVILLCDNDDNCAGTLTEMQKQIRQCEQFGVPARALEWADSDSGLPRIMILPIPWSNETGELETLCLPSAVASMGQSSTCIENFAKCADLSHSCKLPKTRLRILIAGAWPEDPNIALGTVFEKHKTRHLIPVDHACFNQLSNFLAGLLA